MHIVSKKDGQTYSIPAQEISLEDLKHFNSKLIARIIDALKKKEMYPKQLAQELGVHEQLVYYHMRNLEKAGLVVPTKQERIKGSFAKYYSLSKKGFFFKLVDFEPSPKLLTEKEEWTFLKPFIKNGQLDAVIVTGSPDPHGPNKARSRDGYYGIDLGLFIGTFLNYVPKLTVKLDTEITDPELDNNLIIMGGPRVNKVAARINDQLPIRFDDTLSTIYSTITKNSYPEDEIGVIIRMENPLYPKKHMLLVAGKRHAGTRAAIVAVLKHFNELAQGNKYKPSVIARVVEGLDLDSDGIVDDVEFKE